MHFKSQISFGSPVRDNSGPGRPEIKYINHLKEVPALPRSKFDEFHGLNNIMAKLIEKRDRKLGQLSQKQRNKTDVRYVPKNDKELILLNKKLIKLSELRRASQDI